jgi:hypothetical protein
MKSQKALITLDDLQQIRALVEATPGDLGVITLKNSILNKVTELEQHIKARRPGRNKTTTAGGAGVPFFSNLERAIKNYRGAQ